MTPQMNLSPLAFEILKLLCNSSDAENYQILSKDLLNVEDQSAFEQAISELHGENLIEIVDNSGEDEAGDDYTKYVANEGNGNTHHIKLISARINPDKGDICNEMDYYIEAQRDTDV